MTTKLETCENYATIGEGARFRKDKQMKTITLTIDQVESLRGILGKALDEMDLLGTITDDLLAVYIQLTPESE